jgi:hypothetical protein
LNWRTLWNREPDARYVACLIWLISAVDRVVNPEREPFSHGFEKRATFGSNDISDESLFVFTPSLITATN